ncbi:hypothetical protein FACS1894166_12630 [Bacilli bacterium]|nr:hypothetical protein FACS1894166_12630 [Bacilli bacterium]
MPNKLKEINITQFLNVNSKGRVHGFKPGVDLSDLDEILETAPETVLVVGDSRTKIIEDLDFTGILHNAKHVKISKNIELLKCGINGNSIENIYIDNPCLSVGYFAAVGKRR